MVTGRERRLLVGGSWGALCAGRLARRLRLPPRERRRPAPRPGVAAQLVPPRRPGAQRGTRDRERQLGGALDRPFERACPAVRGRGPADHRRPQPLGRGRCEPGSTAAGSSTSSPIASTSGPAGRSSSPATVIAGCAASNRCDDRREDRRLLDDPSDGGTGYSPPRRYDGKRSGSLSDAREPHAGVRVSLGSLGSRNFSRPARPGEQSLSRDCPVLQKSRPAAGAALLLCCG